MTGWIRPWQTRAALAAAMGLGSVPAAGLASDPSAPFVLPGATLTAVTGDIDGDGAREVVRVATVSDAMVLEAWDLVDGAWTVTFSSSIDPFVGPGIQVSDGMAPVALARARASGAERVLVLATGYDSERGMPGCCFTVHELIDAGEGPRARPLATPQLEAESVAVLDVDGDGSDELATTYIRWDEQGDAATTNVELLRRDDDAWASVGAWEAEGAWWVMYPAEADGAPGRELFASGETGDVVRLAWIDGALTESRSNLVFEGQQGWINGGTADALVVALPNSVALVEWPGGGEPAVIATYGTRNYPTIGMIGRGRDALFVVQDHAGSGAPSNVIQVLDADLEPVGEVTIAPEAEELWERLEGMFRGGWGSSRNIWPYVGPADGDWTGGGGSYVIGGMQITAGSGGTFEARPVRSLVGQPLGSVGPADGWMALGDGFPSAGPMAYLQSWYPGVDSRLTITPAAALLEPVEQELLTAVAYEGAIETDRTDEMVTLLAASSGAEIVVTVAPGTVAISWDGSQATDLEVSEDTVHLPMRGPRRPPRDRPAELERELLLIGPEGNVSFHRWEITFAPEAPELTAWTQAEPLSLEAIVAGRAGFGSTVTVDGREVPVNEFGAYRATVDAPPWPRTVVVVARDPFGGEQRATIEVIGLVDYRGLPWVPIAGAATLLGGAALFLRTPRHRPTTQRPPLDDGRLEDLDGDLI
ncbi:MAG TPA: hypothetical protein VLA59_03100 [Patescibacteria group bacterium]|nr:hypothetical protein [Patescibacteria group bacterium]